MDWDKLRIFHAVAEAGSFTHAGDRLSLSQSAVSRQISALEEALNVSLFHRHARGLILTEQGETLNRTVREVFSKLALTEAYLNESKEKAAGKLRVTTTTGFGQLWLTPRIGKFLEKHPDISITLLLVDDDLDLGMREADVAVRMHPPHQGDLVQRHLADFPIPLYASSMYIERHGAPRSLDDLHDHRILSFESWHPPLPNVNWLFDAVRSATGRTVQPYFEVNNLPALASAVEAGLGIGSLPLYVAATMPGLIKLLPDLPVPSIEAFYVYPEELRASKRVTVFRDFLLAEIAATRAPITSL